MIGRWRGRCTKEDMGTGMELEDRCRVEEEDGRRRRPERLELDTVVVVMLMACSGCHIDNCSREKAKG